MKRAPRADAQRNRDRLLTEARVAFLANGTDASLEDIAARAGVGVGTLYRHFPSRETLLEALLRERFDALTERARELADRPAPREALVTWTLAFIETTTVYRGLTAAMTATLRDETSALHASCAAMRDAGTTLLARAQSAGEVRADITPVEFLTLVAGVSWACEQTSGGESAGERLLPLLFEGLERRRGNARSPE
ncbi:TetR/AcrR family transcriptional regulator [Nocardia sp. NBC_00508]|uniref:TetR/AcrR family transcriptional regulator n=1 Tax=Nocardia sp. NBC_00508 TaxID=2975992 RepID=UPI002E7FFF78|nr:helix-turn-helix domain-containing protein [Nocardia sp. NBC_00508]WUD68027.1 TetR/AcrR family transcriptional regulator [Nocardia sp. NBC_00508]